MQRKANSYTGYQAQFAMTRKCIHTSTVHFFSAKNSKVIKSIAQLIANTEMLQSMENSQKYYNDNNNNNNNNNTITPDAIRLKP